jgi:hypothetical protein
VPLVVAAPEQPDRRLLEVDLEELVHTPFGVDGSFSPARSPGDSTSTTRSAVARKAGDVRGVSGS